MTISELNAAQKAFENPDATKEDWDRIAKLRPSGYLAYHSNGSCRVFQGNNCLTPLRSVNELDALYLALGWRIQTDIVYLLGKSEWIYRKDLTF